MGDDNTDTTGLPRDHVRIESTLDWYFNFADSALGDKSNFGAMEVLLNSPGQRTVASSDAAENAMFDAADAVRRYRAVSTIIRRLSLRDQRDLQRSYALRRGRRELASRPAQQRWFAASSPAVRAYLKAHGRKEWTLEAGEALLVLAQQTTKGERLAELVALRVEAWLGAERALAALLRRYADAQRAVAEEETEARDVRVARQRRQLAASAAKHRPVS